MNSNFWDARLSSTSKSYQSALQSRSGMRWDDFNSEMLMGLEEFDVDVDDDVNEEYPCPFCSEYFEIVGLCCHIDEEHPVEARNGVCPVCSTRVGVDMVAHITLQHGNTFKMQRKRKSRKSNPRSTLSLLRELREGNLLTLSKGPSCIASSNSADPDPLLSSFILPMIEDHGSISPYSCAESTLLKTSTPDNISERKVRQAPMSIKDQEEKANRCNFVQGLLFSTILDDGL